MDKRAAIKSILATLVSIGVLFGCIVTAKYAIENNRVEDIGNIFIGALAISALLYAFYEHFKESE